MPVARHIALILVEVETEIEFYSAVSRIYFNGISKSIRNLHGTNNINSKVLDRIAQYYQDNPHNTFDVYICIDQERQDYQVLNMERIHNESAMYDKCVNIYTVVANLMIESLFFIDIDGLYSFLRTPRSRRNPGKYTNFRRFRHQDLSRLFNANGKMYVKGRRCENLVSRLNIEAIVAGADEIRGFVETVIQRKTKAGRH